jgi:acyl carrier protein phosphodiesterase
LNYLAHAYLSFGHPEILLGNMISDFVKGRKQYDYPPLVQEGIRLHRQIDAFTDSHPITAAAKRFFKPAVGAYAGPFVDVAFDHFLAVDTMVLSEEEWKHTCEHTYTQLKAQADLFPEKFARIFPYMEGQDWLFNYRHHWGISNSFTGLSRRAAYLTGNEPAMEAFTRHYDELAGLFGKFFPDVKKMAETHLNDRSIR